MKFSEQADHVRHLVDTEHFRNRRRDGETRGDGEIELTADWGTRYEGEQTPLGERTVSDFRRFCASAMGVKLSADDEGSPCVRWSTASTGRNFDRLDPAFESFEISISKTEILIAARHERGLLHGTHYLERIMSDRGGPFLSLGHNGRSPAFMPRISNSIFIDACQEVTDSGQFSDEYLGFMSHFGVNGIHLFTRLWDFCRSEILPELNTPDFNRRIDQLNRLSARTQQCGIDLYLCIITPPLPASHPVFRAHPDVRGASSFAILESNENLHCLCSHQEGSLRFFEESIINIFNEAPDLAGIVSLVGGEGFFHCFTRPVTPYSGNSSCPACKDIDPSEGVATLVNRCAGALKKTGTHKVYFGWPYSAFTWSGEDKSQQKFLGLLNDDVSVVSNFDTGSPDKVNGDGAHLFDYNIKTIGPSDAYDRQRSRLAALGRPIYAKVETSVTPHAHFVPYIPVHHRWHRRALAMRAAPVAGFIGQWRFYGMNGSLPEELQYRVTWNPEEKTDDALRQIAIRDFEIPEKEARHVVQAWERLSTAWDDFPYSAMLSGERTNYFRGPLYMGPAHPLIFDPQKSYGLSPAFRKLRPDAVEGGPVENEEEHIANAHPHYVDQLMFVLPFGEERFLELIGRCRSGWEEGLSALHEILDRSPTERAELELGVCGMVHIHLASVENVARFYRARDRTWRGHTDLATFEKDIEELQSIAAVEIENARKSLPILERDPRIPFNFCYGNPYTASMVREKIKQCEFVMNEELRIFRQDVRFHIWQEFP